MEHEERILASIIANNDLILVGYNLSTDSTMQFLEDSIKTINKNTSSLIPSKDCNFAYLNENNITYALLTTKGFNKGAVVGFIESIKKAFDSYFPQKDFQSVAKYGLNQQFKEKLFEKMNLFNSNPDCTSEEIIQEREILRKQNDEILMNSNNYNCNKNYSEYEGKAEVLSEQKDQYKPSSIKVKKKKKCSIF